jgi:hypothetical protein
MKHTKRTATTVATLAAGIALAATGCGGSDDSTSAEASTSGGAPYDISYGEFIAAVAPEKTRILKAYVADTPSCNAEVDNGFLLEISAVVNDYDPSTPLPDVVKKYC